MLIKCGCGDVGDDGSATTGKTPWTVSSTVISRFVEGNDWGEDDYTGRLKLEWSYEPLSNTKYWSAISWGLGYSDGAIRSFSFNVTESQRRLWGRWMSKAGLCVIWVGSQIFDFLSLLAVILGGTTFRYCWWQPSSLQFTGTTGSNNRCCWRTSLCVAFWSIVN